MSADPAADQGATLLASLQRVEHSLSVGVRPALIEEVRAVVAACEAMARVSGPADGKVLAHAREVYARCLSRVSELDADLRSTQKGLAVLRRAAGAYASEGSRRGSR